MNTAIIVIDYYLQYVEAGIDKEEARSRAAKMLQNFRGETKKEDYTAICGIIDRLARQ